MENFEELLKLKQLLDAGAITKDEYDLKKKELLNLKVTVKNIDDNVNNNIATNSEAVFETGTNINNTKKKKSNFGCLLVFILFFVPLVVIGILGSSTDNIVLPSSLFAEYNISESATQDIINVINNCGYSKYYSGYSLKKGIDNDEIEGSIGFEIDKGDRVIGFVDIKDEKVVALQYSDKMLVENGEIKHTLDEYLILREEKEALVLKTQEIIKSILKSPSTAKFPWDYDEWNVGKSDGKTFVQGYVDSQNSFGATIRSQFQVTYTNGIVTSVIFDGKEVL